MKIPTPKLPLPLPANYEASKVGETELLSLCLHIKENAKFESAEGFNKLNTKFYARTVNNPPWLLNIKPEDVLSFTSNQGLKGYLKLESIVQSQWEEVLNFYGYVLEGSMFYESEANLL